VGGVALAAVAAAFWLDPIAQDPGYHRFADGRTLLGVPNFWNVATNLAFLGVGLWGLAQCPRLEWTAFAIHYIVFCGGVALVGAGSAWYHRDPSTPTLVWDRLPMTIAFMALLAAVIQDRLSERLGRALLWPLVAGGVASIGWWHWSEMAGQGDLRPYAIVQFLPMLLIPLMLLLYRGRSLREAPLWLAMLAYLFAKLAEYFDSAIYAATGLLSGHSLKHLLAGLAVWCVTTAFLGEKTTKLRPGT
jgi:hypothetical protein